MSIEFDNKLDAAQEAKRIVAKLIADHHPDLAEAKVTFDCLEATKTTKGAKIGGCAVRNHGHPAPAKIKISTTWDRTQNAPDFTITFDSEMWAKATEDGREAIIEHQLLFLEVMREEKDGEDAEKGSIVTDKQHRPRLTRRKADHLFEWFDDAAKRYADASIEVQEAKHFFDEHGQGWLGIHPSLSARPPEALAEKAARAIGGKKPAETSPAAIFLAKIRGRISMEIPEEELEVSTAKIAGWIADKKYDTLARMRKFIEKATPEQIADWTAKLDDTDVKVLLNVLKSSAAEAA